jgi:hypothetical protein
MQNIIWGVLMAVLAPPPIPTQVFTVTISDNSSTSGSIVVSTPPPPNDIHLFEDEKEVLASLTTFSNDDGWPVLSIEMTTVSSTNL